MPRVAGCSEARRSGSSRSLRRRSPSGLTAGPGSTYMRPQNGVRAPRRAQTRHDPKESTMGDEQAYETILYAISGAVATITLNRPEALNTIVSPMPDEVQDAVERAT